ncbi:MAG: hypothetical protein QOC95_1086 [Thermoleophilaceae bacterium]|jgi:hypothetical protein|nr:hypothetical protein [Thermoleophilaceae bacterium]
MAETEHEFSDADDRPVPLDEPAEPDPPVADDDEDLTEPEPDEPE